MTVSVEQIAKAKARGIINVEALAAACEHHSLPFYLALTIVERESPDNPKVTGIHGGANIFGHDHGGALTDPDGHNIEVTEERYKRFLKLIGAGHTSNGVGPMQLTYRGYHIGPQSLQAKGLNGWVPADTMLYGVGILAKSFQHYHGLGMSVEKAFWHTGRDYNNSDTYADAVVERAKFWLTVVGNPDTKPQGDDMPTAKEIADELVPRLSKAIVNELFADDRIKAGADEKDPANKFWKFPTFITADHDVLVEIRDLLKKKP